ncbi:hypothetical protein F4778DRAFT_784289 [Xylariomycetidae sp. FL2044]|nr:hypothetical protein F4778DRAFT_784289 [Xylariomycetidae sp. FL2044]
MKTSAMIVGVTATFAIAQLSTPQEFPECGKTCISNMNGQSGPLGCDDGDGVCLCEKADYSYGVRDCALQACGDASHAQQIIDWEVNQCASLGVNVYGIGSSTSATVPATTTVLATGSPSGSASASVPVSTSEILTTITNSDGSVLTSTIGSTTLSGTPTDAGSAVPISTETIVSTSTNSDGSVIETTLGTSTIFSSSGAASGTQSGSASVTGTESGSASGSVTTFTSTDSTGGIQSVTSTAPSDSETSAGDSNSDSGSATSTTEPGLAVKPTAAPVGIAAIAGLAAFLL